jgi:hypothetical protein
MSDHMPNYKGHLLGGSFAFILVYLFLNKPVITVFAFVQWFCCALLGSLFPDIDIKSKGQMIFYRMLTLVLLVLCVQHKFMIAAGMSVVCMLPLLVKHRGIFHSYIFVTALTIFTGGLLMAQWPAYEAAIVYDCLFFIAGVYSHLLLDFGFKTQRKKFL